MREAAHSIYEEYLSEKANPRLKIDETVVKMLLFKIRSEPPDADWFDESQVAIYAKLQEDERFLTSFKRSSGYVKLLAELDLLQNVGKSDEDLDDEDETNSLSGISIYISTAISSELFISKSKSKTNFST